MTFVAIDTTVKPYLIKLIIDIVDLNNYDEIWVIVLIYAILQLGAVFAWSFYDLFASKIYFPMNAYITKILLGKLNIYSYKFFQERLAGSISSKLSDVANLAPKMLGFILNDFFRTSILLLVSIFFLSTVHYGFVIAILIWISLYAATGYIKMSNAVMLSNLKAESNSRIWGSIVDYIANMFSVKLFSSYSYENNRLTNKLTEFLSRTKTRDLYLRSYFMTQGCFFSIYIISCLCGMIYLKKHNLITTGDFALVFMLNFEIINRLIEITIIVKDFITNLGEVDQALTMLEDSPDIQDSDAAKDLVVNGGKIIFDSIKFNYKGTEELFHNKSVTIESAQKIGLVGYSGSGKSSFVNLILRLHDVTDGSILIDNQDIRDVTQDSLRMNISLIPQDPTLFHRSLRENIRYGKFDATEEEIILASKQAHAHEFIIKLPAGYESLVGERGVKLSGGQRQRIAIARAFLKNAPILILDEATSQLDSVTEKLIQESLAKLIKDKTTIVIAHRLSTLLDMDRILVFDQGKIVEDGAHEDLLKKNGLYRTLWEAQIEGIIPDNKEK